MTPHERAEDVIGQWKRGLGVGEPGLITLITTALQAQSNEDEERHREKQQALRDLLVGWRERNYLVEIKDGEKPPSARTLTADQREWHAAWAGQVLVAESVEDAVTKVVYA